jgi:hypothetical protein
MLKHSTKGLESDLYKYRRSDSKVKIIHSLTRSTTYRLLSSQFTSQRNGQRIPRSCDSRGRPRGTAVRYRIRWNRWWSSRCCWRLPLHCLSAEERLPLLRRFAVECQHSTHSCSLHCRPDCIFSDRPRWISRKQCLILYSKALRTNIGLEPRFRRCARQGCFHLDSSQLLQLDS